MHWLNLSLVITIVYAMSLGCSLLIYRYGPLVGLVDKPNERSSHTFPTPRGGGLGIWLAFIVMGVFFSQSQFLTMLAGIAGLIGLLADRFNLVPKARLISQFIVAIFVVGLLQDPSVSAASLALFLFWVLFITGTANFFNFMDGINGIAGLTGLVAFGLVAAFSRYIAYDSDVTLLALVLSAGCLGFLPFNLPKAKVFMGDVGSIFLGFVFACFVLKLSTNIHVFLCLIMFLSPFYADALVTLFYRWRRGENLMQAHRSHLYQYMSNELNLPHWKVSSIYAMIQAIFGLLALLAYRSGLMWQILLLAIFGGMFLLTYKTLRGIKTNFATSREASL
ncbi:MAG: glycosyltransferase family 4 protein [Nitrospirae bacterium]|nr:glycosyltransferase family 4 protein [Nitrospirota bacterium]